MSLPPSYRIGHILLFICINNFVFTFNKRFLAPQHPIKISIQPQNKQNVNNEFIKSSDEGDFFVKQAYQKNVQTIQVQNNHQQRNKEAQTNISNLLHSVVKLKVQQPLLRNQNQNDQARKQDQNKTNQIIHQSVKQANLTQKSIQALGVSTNNNIFLPFYQYLQTKTTQNIQGTRNSSIKSQLKQNNHTKYPFKYRRKQLLNQNFNGLIIYHQIPLVFYQKQVFQIRGRVVGSLQKNGTYINFILRKTKSGQRFSYRYFIQPDVREFNFKVNFKQLNGQFYLSLFQGAQGAMQAHTYKILQNIDELEERIDYIKQSKTLTTPQKPQNLKINIRNNKVILNWEINFFPLIKIAFIQQKELNEYYLSNFQCQFQVDPADFIKFKQGSIQVQLTSADSLGISYSQRCSQYSQIQKINFQASYHQFQEQNKLQTSLSDIPWQILSGQSISIAGQIFTQIQNKIFILNPNKTFRYQYFTGKKTDKAIPKNTKLNKKILFEQQGTYILEINKVSGGAVLNRPIYVGAAIPVLPDIFDLSNRKLIWNGSNQYTNHTHFIPNQNQILLNLINQKRKQFNAGSVQPSNQLDQLAVIHSEDMIKNNYFNHVNLQKKTPQQRANQRGIFYKTGENIAVNVNLTEAHYKLCRSPIHLQNMVDSSWQQVGLGIKMNQNGVYYIVQQFGIRNLMIKPFNDFQYSQYKHYLLENILSQNNDIKSENQGLSNIMRNQLIGLGTNINDLGFRLLSMGFKKFSLGSIKVIYSNKFIQKLKGKNYFKPQGLGYSQIGLTILTSQQQYLIICVVYV